MIGEPDVPERHMTLAGPRRFAPRRLPFLSEANLRSTSYLLKWLVLGSLVGVVAGFGAILFTRAIGWVTELVLGEIVGYTPPAPVGEGDPIRMDPERPWLMPLVLGIGGLISGLIVFRFAPEAEGHGTDSAIDAIHHKRSVLRARVPPIKLISSAITIGSGGSGGREGPAAQISSGFGSLLGQWLNLSIEDRRTAVSAGMGAGIGAIFRAPLGGALMAAEILYLHDLEVQVLIPALIASIVGYSVYGYFEGFSPIFGDYSDLVFHDPVTLIYYALLGILAGIMGIIYARTFYGTAGVFHRLRIPRSVKPAIGGFLVGIMGIYIVGSIHTGYGWVQIAMSPDLKALPLWLVLALPFAKILATSLSIGSGGSGGIFGPGMVIGGMLGAAFWRLAEGTLPHMPDSPAPFVIVGMMALFGGIAHAPFAVMLMVAEMTGNLTMLAPAMVAVALSSALVGDETIYKAQLPNRASSPLHRVRMSFPLLSALSVRDAMEPFDAEAANGGLKLKVEASMPLDRALERMADEEVPVARVVDGENVLGQVSYRGALTAYRQMLQRGVRRARALPESSLIVETRLRKTSCLVGMSLRKARLPHGTLVASITRSGTMMFPHADTVLEPGDLVTIVTEPGQASRVRALAEGRAQPVEPEPIQAESALSREVREAQEERASERSAPVQ
jgi:CIC family chloride channel protein